MKRPPKEGSLSYNAIHGAVGAITEHPQGRSSNNVV